MYLRTKYTQGLKLKVFPVLVFLAVIGNTNTSCKKKKEKVISESHFSYEMNGVPFEIKSKTDITFSFVGKIQTTGKETPSNWLFLRTPKMLIRVKDYNTPIAPGHYSGRSINNNGELKGVEISYTETNNMFYESSLTSPVTEVEIKQISRDGGVHGTFRGWVMNNDVKADTLRFEKGQFSIFTYTN